MSTPDVHTEVAESILEHAQAIARLNAASLGAGRQDDAACASACAGHVNAMRVLAVPYIDPLPDRELVRALRTVAADVPGVFVHLVDGAIELIVDNPARQFKVKLWNGAQLLKNEEDDELEGE